MGTSAIPQASDDGLGRVLESEQIKRAYAVLSPVYDLLFNKIFHAGRVAAVDLLDIRPGDRVLEVGIGTGLNLPLYPRQSHLTGIDISEEMLCKAEERLRQLHLRNAAVHVMDASQMAFPNDAFDHVLATYVMSAVPDPVRTLHEIKRVCKRGGNIVILNHFRSEHPLIGGLEALIAPLCTRIGFKSDLKLRPLLAAAALPAEEIHRVNLLKGWRLVRCKNPK